MTVRFEGTRIYGYVARLYYEAFAPKLAHQFSEQIASIMFCRLIGSTNNGITSEFEQL